jgi:RimJ/RimL family protein N-acetyltransferase
METVNMDHPVYLRALDACDLEKCHTWHNDQALYETLVGYFHFVNKGAEQAWFDSKKSVFGKEVNLAICVRETDEHIGNIYLREIDWVSRRAQLGIFIGDRDARSKGYGYAAMRQLLCYAFNDLGLKKIWLDVLSDNAAAIRLYEKCGFKSEGLLRKHVYKNGRWNDLVMMGIWTDEDSNQ